MGNSSSTKGQRQKGRHQVLRFDNGGPNRNSKKPGKRGKMSSKPRSRMERNPNASNIGLSFEDSSDSLNGFSSSSKERSKRFDNSRQRTKATKTPVRRMMTDYEDEDEEEEALPPPPALTVSQRQQQRLQSAFHQKRMSLSSAKSSAIVENFVPKKRDKTKSRARQRQSVVSVLSNIRDADSAGPLPPKHGSFMREGESATSEPFAPTRSNGKSGAKADANFVDYTVVPILLRADMSYNKATEFGENLKKHYLDRDVHSMMANPYALFTALEKEGFRVDDDVKRNVISDKYWTFVKESGSAAKRKSYVYYAEHDDDTASRRRSVSKKTRDRSRRESVRSEFVPTMAEDSDEDEEVQVTEAALRQSMRFLDALKQAEKSTPKEKQYQTDSNGENEDCDDLFV